MSLTIRQKADTVGTFRHLSVEYMETLSRWVPTTPEMELKILFGRHIWELAQHADALGQRTHELRAALHFSLAPAGPYAEQVAKLTALSDSGERFFGFYTAALPDLDRRLVTYLEDTDVMLDEPTVRILERIRTDYARMTEEHRGVAAECPQVTPADASVVGSLVAGFAAVAGFDFVAFRASRATNLEIFP